MTQGHMSAGALTYRGREKGRSIIASLEILCSSVTLVDRKLKMTSIPEDLQRPLKKLRELQVVGVPVKC
ncbi:hypothetical protein WJX77_000656 [Trebouxia sp. C0004]